MAGEIVILDPKEVSLADRAELNLHVEPFQVREEGIDWGTADIEAFMSQQQYGEAMIDYRLPNRTITIPLTLGAVGNFEVARIALQAKVSRINEEGGWLKRELPSGTHGFFDLVKATLKYGGSTWQARTAGFDPDVELVLEALPDFYGDPIELGSFEGTAAAQTTAQVKGNLPGRVDLTVTDKSANDQLGLGWHFRCKHYDPAATAVWTYEAEELTPLDLAEITTLASASPSGSAAFNTIRHNSLGTGWTPVLSTNPMPKVRSVGASKAGAGAEITVPLPAGVQENDILLMYVETETVAVVKPTGWEASIANSEVATAEHQTRMSVFWKRATAAEVAPIVKNPDNHIIARIVAVSGCITTGNPWNVTGTSTELVSDVSVEFASVTTTVDSCLVLQAVATGTDLTSAAQASAWANANLQAVVENIDSWTAEGGGGGFGVASGYKTRAGAIGATTATLATANYKAMITIALKPETGGNYLTHKGLYNVWARVYTTSTVTPYLRLRYDVGDIVAPSTNEQVRIPTAEAFYLVNLGQVNLREAPVGPHRWQGVVQAAGVEGNSNVYIDRLFFFCADESSGVLSAPISGAVPLAGYGAQDSFVQVAGALNGKALSTGQTWETAGGAEDLKVESTGHTLERISIAVEPGRSAFVKGYTATDTVVQADFKYSARPSGNLSCVLFARWINASNNVWCVIEPLPSGTHINVRKTVGGSGQGLLENIAGETLAASLMEPGLWYTLKLVVSKTGAWELWFGPQGKPVLLRSGFQAVLAPGGALAAAGQIGLEDAVTSVSAVKRNIDNFSGMSPDSDAVFFASKDLRLLTAGPQRRSADGIAYGSVAYPGTDLPRVPVSGPEARPVEVALKPSRGDFDKIPDSGLDLVKGQLTYRPCWSYVPGE